MNQLEITFPKSEPKAAVPVPRKRRSPAAIMENLVDARGNKYVKMSLTNSDKSTLIDPESVELANSATWYLGKNGYVCGNTIVGGLKKAVYLHRSIINAPSGFDVDHKNKDPLDNRKGNLRVASRSQNMHNSTKKIRHGQSTSTFKGVWLCPTTKRWCAMLKLPGEGNKRKWLGRHETEVAAALAYNEAAKEVFGEFAQLNTI